MPSGGGVGGSGAPLVVERLPRVIDTLQPPETVTAITTTPRYTAVGTSLGSVYVFDVQDKVIPYGSPTRHFDGITALAAGPEVTFAPGNGVVYYGTVRGALLRRARHLDSFSDDLIFKDSPAVSLFQSVWHGLPVAQHDVDTTALCPITQLLVLPAHMLWCWNQCIMLYSTRQNELVGKLCLRRSDDDSASSDKVSYVLNSSLFFAAWGNHVYQLPRDLDTRPFTPLRQFRVPGQPVRDLGLLGDDFLAIMTSAAVTGTNAADAPPAAGSDASPDAADSERASMPAVPGAASVPPQLTATQVSLFACSGRCASGPMPRLGSVTFHIEAGAVPGAPWLMTGVQAAAIAGHHNIDASDISVAPDIASLWLVFPRDLIVFRPPSVAEHVVWLCERGSYPEAVRATTRVKRRKPLIEVTNAYCCDLWENRNDRRQAMVLWAETLFPVAPAAYWEELIRRLAQLDELALIEPFLPFNDRRLVSPATYLMILTRYLERRQFKSFYDRVSAWPVLYSPEEMEKAVHAVLDSQRGQSASEEEQLVQWLHMALYKLYDFQNRFGDALDMLLRVDSPDAPRYWIAHAASMPSLTDFATAALLRRVLAVDAARDVLNWLTLSYRSADGVDIVHQAIAKALPAVWYRFLVAVTHVELSLTAKFHDDLLELYLEHGISNNSATQRQSVLSVLQISKFCDLDRAMSLCRKHSFDAGKQVVAARIRDRV